MQIVNRPRKDSPSKNVMPLYFPRLRQYWPSYFPRHIDRGLWPRSTCRLRKYRPILPRQAEGLGAPQMIIRRPLPSPDWHNKSLHTGCSCGSVPPPCGEHFSSYRLHVRNFHTSILACIVDNIFISFSHRSPRPFRFIFHFSKLFFLILL